MSGKLWLRWAMAATLVSGALAQDRERRARIDVEHYDITAEVNPRTQSVSAAVDVRFVPLEDNASTTVFELNNALNVSRVTDAEGRQIPASRMQQDFSIRLNHPDSLKKGTAVTVRFAYDGRITGQEESPVYGIKFATIAEDYAYLMTPARWFPTTDYSTDRYTAELKITVPESYSVIGSGIETVEAAAGAKRTFRFRFTQPSFPGSIAVVRGQPQRTTAGGATALLYFRGEEAAMAQQYGEEVGKVLTYFTSIFGLAPYSTIAVVQTDEGTPNGYAAPGILFLSPRTIGKQVNQRVLANQLARQWWGVLASPATRNHLWITNGMARYAELLYQEHRNGANSIEAELRDVYVEALTVDNPPLIQASRLEDYAPEYWALTAAKGASVLHMLRFAIGDENFGRVAKAIPEKFAWKSLTTEQFKDEVNGVVGEDMGYFFIQWIESSGAPEFKLEYTVFRTTKGFRVMGKVSQDLDTFRMPVDLRIETEGNPEEKRIEVVGTSSEFVVETFGKPKRVDIDATGRVLRFDEKMRIAVAIRRGEQFAEIGEFNEALKEYQKALEVNRNSSLAHYRVAEIFFLQNNYQSAANEFREALNGDLEPKWTEVWSHINLGKIFDITNQRERALNEYQQAIRTKDNTQGAQEEAAKYLKEAYKRPRQTV